MPEAVLAPRDLRAMICLMRALYRLHHHPLYYRMIADQLPPVARFNPGNEAVMMGYDFHLTPDGPKLIEVNTNAGGGLLAYRAYGLRAKGGQFDPANAHQRALLHSFATEMALFSAGKRPRPTRVAILDHAPETQFLFEEMQLLRRLLENWGVAAVVVAPEALEIKAEGVCLKESMPGGRAGDRIDLIYNRHCDFYLETPALAGLRTAYLAGKVCVTPNPRIYGLLADKRRMILWSNETILQTLGMSDRERRCIVETVPVCHLLAHQDPEQVWRTRKRWVFKPITAYGSRGVLLGNSISRKRFTALDPHTTLMQQHIPPSVTYHANMDKTMKTDFRLFVYRNKTLGVAARLYHGQVTNFREPGSGYCAVRI